MLGISKYLNAKAPNIYNLICKSKPAKVKNGQKQHCRYLAARGQGDLLDCLHSSCLTACTTLNQDAQGSPCSPAPRALPDFGDALHHEHAWLARTSGDLCGCESRDASSSTMGALRPEHVARSYIRDLRGMGHAGRRHLHPRVHRRRK